MASTKALLKIQAGTSSGDTLSIDQGICRLVGRHLSEGETAMIDRDGNRALGGAAKNIIKQHLEKPEEKAQEPAIDDAEPTSTFERGADIILGDTAISRVHAMIFFDSTGIGVIDLASTNGTFVNDKQVNSTRVKEAGVIRIGNSELVVHFQ